MMESIRNIFESIKSTSSKIDKENILVQHKGNKDFINILEFLYNPYKMTGISTKKVSKYDGYANAKTRQFDSLFQLIEFLLENNTGKDEYLKMIGDHMGNYLDTDVIDFCKEVIAKSYKCGITASTINKAYGKGFIPVFDLMLAEKYIETKKIKDVAKVYEHWKRYIGKRVIATKKLDGNRVAVLNREDGSVELFSREGHKLEGFVEIENAFMGFPKGQVYDGEILATNEEGLNSQDLFTKTSRIVKKKGVKENVEFHAFDMLPIVDFEMGGYDVACETRKVALEVVVNVQSHPLVKYVEPLYIGEYDYDLMEQLAQAAKENGEEGIMIQLAEVGYECKRTFSILKVKSFESADVRCLGAYEGKTGKNIGRLGGLVLDYKGYRINVGGGFSDEQRISIWADPSQVIGKIVEITYFEEFENDEGELDLRFGIFKTIRDDKTEPSYH